jgi:hypothetical protein
MVMGASQSGRELIGNNAPDRPKIGKMTKFIMS